MSFPIRRESEGSSTSAFDADSWGMDRIESDNTVMAEAYNIMLTEVGRLRTLSNTRNSIENDVGLVDQPVDMPSM